MRVYSSFSLHTLKRYITFATVKYSIHPFKTVKKGTNLCWNYNISARTKLTHRDDGALQFS